MPASKNPRRKAAPIPRVDAPTGHVLPDRRAMERHLAAIAGNSRDDALAQAQDIMYEAWERTTSRSRVTLARRALAISPLCADAYNLLAQEAATVTEARDLYGRALDAGELALGPEGFAEYDGHFWGFLETRPYMRARHGLALTLLKLGEEDAAIAHFRAMLKLNPNDNQGIRYLLLACLLRREDTESVKALLAAYADEWSTYWLYTRALIAYREGRANEAETLKLVNGALAENRHVPGILARTQPPTPSESDYLSVGGADEATEYVRDFRAAWEKIPGAIDWLMTIAGDSRPTKRRSSRSIH
jgi:tetratricopeptide (TPR) repeat protein